MATCTRGRVVTMRALPSLVTVDTAPFSATAKLQPLTPMVRRDELAAQLHAGHLDQLLDVGVLLFARGLGEVVGHLVARKMDGGHDHVGGAFMAQLDDPFAQVRLAHDQAFGLPVLD